ncbi:MAG TPA: heterodisulfide reductase-related iron-sulfur binding cluster [Syntrophorhabdaceae bacterium]|nr:heterodisulfide reductase-related iron-sulfur binding cluster [Syntrophorhabdaceae bacterium]
MTTLSYYPGCSLKTSSSFYEHSLRKILSFYGIELKELDDWSCCGASAAPTINDKITDVLGARNIAIAEREGLHLVAPCSACYARTKVAASRIQQDRETREMVNRAISPLVCTGSLEVRNVIEVFLEYIGTERISDSAVYDLGTVRAAAYYGCVLTRTTGAPPSDDIEDPVGMDIILRCLGADPVAWQHKTECCGAGATITNKKMTASLSGHIMDMAAAAGANAVVTTCPLCQLNLDLTPHLKKDSAKLPVFFLTEIFELALFGAIEWGKRHLIPVDDILKSIGTPGDDVA